MKQKLKKKLFGKTGNRKITSTVVMVNIIARIMFEVSSDINDLECTEQIKDFKCKLQEICKTLCRIKNFKVQLENHNKGYGTTSWQEKIKTECNSNFLPSTSKSAKSFNQNHM